MLYLGFEVFKLISEPQNIQAQDFTLLEDASEKEEEVFEKIKAIIKSDPLEKEAQDKTSELLSFLESPVYEERESATLELLLLPSGVVGPLWNARKNPELEIRERIHFVLHTHLYRNPLEGYLARIAGIPYPQISTLLHGGEESFIKLIERLPLSRMTQDIRIWARLYLAAQNEKNRELCITHLKELRPQENYHKALYLSLLNDFHTSSASRERRAQLLSTFPKDASLQRLLNLAEATLQDQEPEITFARKQLFEKFKDLIEPHELLTRYQLTHSKIRKGFMIDLLSFKNASSEVRKEWITLAQGEQNPLLKAAFLDLACRENLYEMLQISLEELKNAPEELSENFFVLLTTLGDSETWEQALELLELSPNNLSEALRWLPFSKIGAQEQVSLLLPLLDSKAESIVTTTLHLLQGYGTQDVVQRLIDHIKASPSPLHAHLETLSFHSHLLPELVPKITEEPWFQEAQTWVQASLLGFYQEPFATELLEKLLFSPDVQTSETAAFQLARNHNTFMGCQLLAYYALMKDLDSTMLMKLERTENQAFIELQRLEAKRHNTPDFFSTDDNLHSLSLALSLALKGYPELEEFLQENSYYRNKRFVFLSLWPGDKGERALEKALFQTPQEILSMARLFLFLDKPEIVIKSLYQTAKAELLAGEYDIPAIAAAIHSPKAQKYGNKILGLLSYLEKRELLKEILFPLALQQQKYLDEFFEILQATAMTYSTSQFRALLLLATAHVPQITQGWFSTLKTLWQKNLDQNLKNLFIFLENLKLTPKGRLPPAPDQLDDQAKFLASLLRARFGSSPELHKAWQGTLKHNPSEPFLRTPRDFKNVHVLFNLSSLLSKIPERFFKWSDLQHYWLSTRYLWEYSHESRTYQLALASIQNK